MYRGRGEESVGRQEVEEDVEGEEVWLMDDGCGEPLPLAGEVERVRVEGCWIVGSGSRSVI